MPLAEFYSGALAELCSGVDRETGFGVAALMGTSISQRQLEMLSEAGPEVIVCLDGDDAGTETAPQVAARIAEAGLWVTIRRVSALKPHHEDIEDFCRRFGEV